MNFFIDNHEICKKIPEMGAFDINILYDLKEIQKLGILLQDHFLDRGYEVSMNIDPLCELFGDSITWRKSEKIIKIYDVSNIIYISGEMLSFDDYFTIKKDSPVRGIYHAQKFNI